MNEKFYISSDGRKLVFAALDNIGSGEEACSFAHMHGYRKNGFPEGHPSPNELDSYNLWDSLLAGENRSDS